MEKVFVQCPNCQTQYAPSRLGIRPVEGLDIDVTVKCLVCTEEFNAIISFVQADKVVEIVSDPGWFSRVILRKQRVVKETVTEAKFEVTSALRTKAVIDAEIVEEK